MLARVATFAIDGVDPRQVWVEVDIRPGLPAFTIVGLGDAAVRESRDRVRAAILNSGFKFPERRITANLAPAFLRKAGPGFDAALALAVLAASGQVPTDGARRRTRSSASCRSAASCATRRARWRSPRARGAPGFARLIVPRERAREAALVDGLDGRRRRSAARGGRGRDGRPIRRRCPSPGGRRAVAASEPDLADVRGHAAALLALQIAAAGGHNLLLEGAPGTGKTMLARRLPSILPAMTRAEAIEVTRIHSVAGIARRRADRRAAVPRAAPHDLAGRPGRRRLAAAARGGHARQPRRAVSRRALGVPALEPRGAAPAARGRLRDDRPRPAGAACSRRGSCWSRRRTRARAGSPASADRCACGEADLRRHRRRLSGPLLDRMDLLVDVRRADRARAARRRRRPTRRRPASASREARERQRARLAGHRRELQRRDGRPARPPARPARRRRRAALGRAYAAGALSARGRHRVLRVARTIADLERPRARHPTPTC